MNETINWYELIITWVPIAYFNCRFDNNYLWRHISNYQNPNIRDKKKTAIITLKFVLISLQKLHFELEFFIAVVYLIKTITEPTFSQIIVLAVIVGIRYCNRILYGQRIQGT